MTTPDVTLARTGDHRLTTRGLRRAGRRIAPALVYGALPILLLAVMVLGSVHDHFAFDFHQFWQGGRDVVEGRSPYPSTSSLPDGGDPSLGAVAIQEVYRFPYPAPAALAMVPFGALPFSLAAALFVAISIAAVVLALRLLEVRDWRCYGLVFASITTLGALRLGTFTPLLLLGLAIAWRYRERRLIAGAAVAVLVMLKLFLWPLFVWLLMSRRIGAAAIGFALACVVTAVSWAALGFAGLGDYPELLSSLTASVQTKGWSVVALGLALGLSMTTAKVVAVVLATALLSCALLVSRERRDLWAFTLALAAALVLTPIVWLHYFLLLVAPLAIAHPALAPAWFVPLAFWIWPFQETGGDVWKIAFGLVALAAACIATLARTPRTRPA